jgi:hypothetical protein
LIRSARDLIELEKAERLAVRKHYGALNAGLVKDMERMNPQDSIDVVIHMKVELSGPPDRTKASLEEQKAYTQAWLHRKPLVRSDILARRYGLRVVTEEKGRPEDPRALTARVAPATLLQLAHLPEIATIERKTAASRACLSSL